MTRLTQSQAVEFIEATYFTEPDIVTDTHVEAFIAADAADVRTDMDLFTAFMDLDIDPDSYTITPDAIEDMGISAAKIIIRTEVSE